MAESLSLGILQSIKQNALLADSILLIFTYPVLCDWLDFKNLTLYRSYLFCIMRYFQCSLLSSKESSCQFKRLQRHRFYPWVRKISWRKAWQPTYVIMMTVFYVKYLWRKLREKKKRVAILNEDHWLWFHNVGFEECVPGNASGYKPLCFSAQRSLYMSEWKNKKRWLRTQTAQ